MPLAVVLARETAHVQAAVRIAAEAGVPVVPQGARSGLSGAANALFLHVTLLPYIGATHELKTKPTQHSVKELLRAGIQPDVILCRADYEVSDEIRGLLKASRLQTQIDQWTEKLRARANVDIYAWR